MQNLQKKHALLESDVSSRQDRIDGIVSTADVFVDKGHFDSDNIKAKQVRVPPSGPRNIIVKIVCLCRQSAVSLWAYYS